MVEIWFCKVIRGKREIQQMRYLDIEGKIYYDVENGKIVFSEEPDKSFALKDMMSKRARTVF